MSIATDILRGLGNISHAYRTEEIFRPEFIEWIKSPFAELEPLFIESREGFNDWKECVKNPIKSYWIPFNEMITEVFGNWREAFTQVKEDIVRTVATIVHAETIEP